MVYNLFIMTENAPSPVFYASAKPEAPKVPQKEDSKFIKGVKNIINKWLERIGSKGVEDRFVKAHQNILNTLTDEERKNAYAQTENKWRRAGKIAGVTATVLDVAISGYGIVTSVNALKNPEAIMEKFGATSLLLARSTDAGPKTRKFGRILHGVYQFLYGHPAPGFELHTENVAALGYTKRDDIVNKSIAASPSLIALQTAAGFGPSKIIAHLAASGTEGLGKMKAKTNNYVDSGKAAEHAAKVGNAIGKAATETAKWAAEHPDEIRKTVETVSKVKKEHAESAQKIAQAKQKAADAKLDAEYTDWVAHHPDKTYFEQSGTPPPSKADYVEMKAREAAAKKANKEAEDRGVAKR